METRTNHIISAITAATAVMAYIFWALPFRAALSYREQLQLFQTTYAYFTDHLPLPGGIAAYIGEFLTQFFNNYWIGAGVMTVLLLLFLTIFYCINREFTQNSTKILPFILAIIPMSAIWLYFGNTDVTLCFLISLLTAAASSYLFISINTKTSGTSDYPAVFLLTSLTYWIAGQATVAFTLLTVSYTCLKGHYTPLRKAIFSVISVAWLSANLFIWSRIITYPLNYQLIGIGYLMIPAYLNPGQIIVEISCVAVPLMGIPLSRLSPRITVSVTAVAIAAAIILIYPRSYDSTTCRLIDYDYMVRSNDWEGIIRYSNKYDPDLPMSVSATNLALGMTGQLDSRAFAYFQHGAEGLVPPFTKETLSSWTTGEILFQLGMINSAQRFYFEGMEAIPNYNKSSRAIKRLAETAIIRGEYTLAEKYLHLLENTLFYKKWAQRNLLLIKESGGVERHPLYGRLRGRMIDEEYMFSEGEIDKTLGQLFLKDNGNTLAKQYLIVYPLLQRDLNKFMQYMGVVAEKDPHYNPLLAQQTIAFISMKNGSPVPRGMVPQDVEQSLRDFARAWTSKDQESIAPYRRTLFHYLLSTE